MRNTKLKCTRAVLESADSGLALKEVRLLNLSVCKFLYQSWWPHCCKIRTESLVFVWDHVCVRSSLWRLAPRYTMLCNRLFKHTNWNEYVSFVVEVKKNRHYSVIMKQIEIKAVCSVYLFMKYCLKYILTYNREVWLCT